MSKWESLIAETDKSAVHEGSGDANEDVGDQSQPNVGSLKLEQKPRHLKTLKNWAEDQSILRKGPTEPHWVERIRMDCHRYQK